MELPTLGAVLTDRAGRRYVPAVSPRLRVLLVFIFAAVAVLGATGIYLLAISALEIAGRQTLQNFFSLSMLLIHVLIGAVVVVPFFVFGLLHWSTARLRTNRRAIRTGMLLFLTGSAVCLTGVALIQLSGMPQLPDGSTGRWIMRILHIVTPVAAVAIYVRHRKAGPHIRWRWGIGWGVAVGAFTLGMVYLHSTDPRRWHAQGSPEGEKYFEPARSRTVDGNFIPASALMMDEYCLKCHADIYQSHLHSAHRFSSFNNPAYLFSVKETRIRMGTRAARWCAGCHDPVPFFSGQFDDPDYDLVNHPTAKAGITCTACHAMTNINSRSGNGDYTIEEPIHYPFAASDNPVLQWLNNQLVKAKPDFHKKTFLKPFHRTEEFCSTCHKVGVPQEVNHYKEFLRGQNHPDSFLLSGVSGHGARSFYYPPTAKTRCADCHMPLMPSNDFGRKDFDQSGIFKVHNHLFPGANTGVAALVKYPGYEDVIKAHEKFLQGGIDGKSPSLRIDLFGLKHLQGEGGVETPLVDNQPLRPSLPRLQPGASYLVEVVIRTLNVGHHFTQGTADSNEVWVEFTARSGGRVIAQSGALDGRDSGRVDEWAHFLNVLMLDRHGNRIDRRNPQDIFTPLYDHQIPPGAAQVVHYRLQLPGDLIEPVELSARVRYRKFDYTYMELVHGAGKVPALPIVDLCSDRIVLAVSGGKEAPPQTSPIPAWQRWNDYGIGCFLEGGPDGKGPGEKGQAEAAFQRLLSPEFNDAKDAHAHGHLNLARVHLAYGGQERLDKAREALIQARRCDPPAPWWTVAWFNGLVDIQNGNFEAAIKSFEQILDPSNRDPVRKLDFTLDYVVRNELGKTLFLRAQQEESPAADKLLRRAIEQFEQTLELDAEDVVAHEFLGKCFGRLATGSGVADLPSPETQEEKELRRQVTAERLPALVSVLAAPTISARTPVLIKMREQLLKTPRADVRARLFAAQALTHLDRHLLAALPDLGSATADASLDLRKRRQAAEELIAVLTELAIKPPPVDARPVVGYFSAWPQPGSPVNLALETLADEGFLQGPLPPPRVLALQKLRRQIRPLFETDDEWQGAAAAALARIHLLMHGIYKPDEAAQGYAIGVYRRRHPAADRASHPIVIYDAR
jgi:tetratricopeptide (TPR) repeat protein/NADH:ubiquinone oxidoreductase subunit 6 (subunit J)